MSAFDGATTPEVNTETTQEQQAEPGVLESLVGEDKKFKSVEDLAKGKAESDKFIEQLQSELSGLREELDKRLTAEDVLTKIREENSANQSNGEPTSSSLSEDKVAELVKSTLESTRTEEQRQANIASVDQKLQEMYGDKANAELQKKAAELGVGVDFLASVAMQSPAAFFNTVGINANQQAGGVQVSTSTVNTEVLAQQGEASQAKAGSKAYFDQMRKDNPKLYWDPKTQNQIMEARASGAYS